MIRFKDFKHKTALSYSRIKTFDHCSQKYYCTYILKMPDAGNDGSNRGNALHHTLELLAKDKRRDLVEKVIKAKSCQKFPALWKLITAYAKKWNVNDAENLETIDQFIVTALKTDFYGPPETIETHIEKEFDFEIEEDGLDFRAKGYIDKFHICKDENSLYICGRDFKGSKTKFSDIKENLQGALYQMAFQILYPNIPLRDFKFIFVKFPKQPIQEFPLYSEAQLYGLKLYLTHLQTQIDNFSEKNVNDNFGALNPKMKFLCGPAKSGWICPHQNPLDYYVLLDKDKKIIKSAFKEEDLVAEEGQRIEIREYAGCNYFFKNGKRRGHSYE